MVTRNILIRFDDICSTMNWEQWEKAMQILKKINATALLGVVPDCKDAELQIDSPRIDFWEYINHLQDQGFTIAMHGYEHVYCTKADGIVTKSKQSEFAGLPYENQLEKIRKGKSILNKHGIFTDVFFAPSHSYDDNTLRALKECGFRYISDGMSKKPYLRQGIICLPCRSFGIPKIHSYGYYTVVIHAHTWANPKHSYDFIRFRDFCQTYKNDIVSFEKFCNWSIGNTTYQRSLEYIHIVLQRYIIPTLRQIRNWLKK